jgi:hypothetical protein
MSQINDSFQLHYALGVGIDMVVRGSYALNMHAAYLQTCEGSINRVSRVSSNGCWMLTACVCLLIRLEYNVRHIASYIHIQQIHHPIPFHVVHCEAESNGIWPKGSKAIGRRIIWCSCRCPSYTSVPNSAVAENTQYCCMHAPLHGQSRDPLSCSRVVFPCRRCSASKFGFGVQGSALLLSVVLGQSENHASMSMSDRLRISP